MSYQVYVYVARGDEDSIMVFSSPEKAMKWCGVPAEQWTRQISVMVDESDEEYHHGSNVIRACWVDDIGTGGESERG